MRRAVTFPIVQAERTVLAPALLIASDYEFPTRARFEEEHLDLEALLKLNARAVDAELATLQPRYVRDRKNVIVYAEIRAQRPLLASVVLAPKFRELFKETLGERLLVAVPSRFVAFVFAGLTRDYQQYAPMVLEEYRSTPFPVSTEVFELSVDGLKAVGMYEAP